MEVRAAVPENGAIAKAFLSCTADLAVRTRDVIERLVFGRNANRVKSLQHPII